MSAHLYPLNQTGPDARGTNGGEDKVGEKKTSTISLSSTTVQVLCLLLVIFCLVVVTAPF